MIREMNNIIDNFSDENVMLTELFLFLTSTFIGI